jgi:hypothetical protein
LKREAILEHLGMAALQIDQFTQALFWKVESVIIACAILILVVGIPLYWLRLKAERALIRVIRSARARRQAQSSAATANESASDPHCPVCNALMVRRVARRGPGAGSTFCISLVPTRLDRCPGGFTGHVAHPSRSIGVVAIIPSAEAREGSRFLSGVTAPGYSFHRNVTVSIASSEYFVPDIR